MHSIDEGWNENSKKFDKILYELNKLSKHPVGLPDELDYPKDQDEVNALELHIAEREALLSELLSLNEDMDVYKKCQENLNEMEVEENGEFDHYKDCALSRGGF